MIKVSVVVPVFNPGPFIEPGIESILAQTMPADELEAVFVDDGSTDETPARLDDLAAAHPNVRVIHTPNSGWAGRPRNIGIGEARGEYIQFMDQDDSLTPDALARLYEMAVRNRSDIVIGKVASNFRPVPQHLFRRNIDACTIRDAPLISSLTPHKMFRTAFLRDRGIEFPEGRRRLEDQLFMVRAYLAAGTVSVLADHVCYIYARRADGGNAAAHNPDPAMYFANLREILEVVVANTEPGPFRTELLGRFYRTGMIDRLSEPFYLIRPEPVQQALYREIRALASDFADDGVHARLGTVRRVRSDLLRADRQPALLELARRLRRLRASASLRDVRWSGRRLRVELDARLEFQPDGRPFRLLRRGGTVQLDPWILAGILDAPVPVHEPSPWVRLECFLHERATGAEWRVPTAANVDVARTPAPDGGEILEPRITGVATVDLDRIAGGHAIDAGSWELRARVFGPGIDRRARVIPVGTPPPPALLVPQGEGIAGVATVSATRGLGIRTLWFAPAADPGDGAGIGTRAGESTPAPDLVPMTGNGERQATAWIELPASDLGSTASQDLSVDAIRHRSRRRLASRLEGPGGARVVAVQPGALLDMPGTWRVVAAGGDPPRAERTLAILEVGAPGRSDDDRGAGSGRSLVGGARRIVRRRARSLARRLSASARRRIPVGLTRWL